MKALEIFAGPCMLESRDLALESAERLAACQEQFPGEIAITFKGSFDKANRTSLDSPRGPGLEKGLRILEEVGAASGLPTITDFHLPDQAEPVAQAASVLQIPAFLCRQTDMIAAGARACAKHQRRLNIKKGQFLAPRQVKHLVDKAGAFLPKDQILITERGSCFGHEALVVDMASFSIIKSCGVSGVHDATHCVQRPGGGSKTTGGAREFVEPLALAALAAGADAIFAETHPDPAAALSDAATQLPLDEFPQFVGRLLKVYRAVQS